MVKWMKIALKQGLNTIELRAGTHTETATITFHQTGQEVESNNRRKR